MIFHSLLIVGEIIHQFIVFFSFSTLNHFHKFSCLSHKAYVCFYLMHQPTYFPSPLCVLLQTHTHSKMLTIKLGEHLSFTDQIGT